MQQLVSAHTTPELNKALVGNSEAYLLPASSCRVACCVPSSTSARIIAGGACTFSNHLQDPTSVNI